MIDKPYHHGDLPAALLTAAEAELAERGVEAFSLRSVAKRAGVSHAAPAHHFGDAGGLLTALATQGFRRFLDCQHRREAAADPDPVSQMVAAGIGYVDFALESPALFRLIFASDRLNRADPALVAAGAASYGHLVDQVKTLGGGDTDVAAAWSMVHGLADLMITGRLAKLRDMDPAARDAVVAGLVRRIMPGTGGGQLSDSSGANPP
jgi:AcrR family transcriptional regulator